MITRHFCSVLIQINPSEDENQYRFLLANPDHPCWLCLNWNNSIGLSPVPNGPQTLLRWNKHCRASNSIRASRFAIYTICTLARISWNLTSQLQRTIRLKCFFCSAISIAFVEFLWLWISVLFGRFPPNYLSQSQILHESMALSGNNWLEAPATYNTAWWFGTFFVFRYIGNNHPNWLIFFRWFETTNQNIYRLSDYP